MTVLYSIRDGDIRATCKRCSGLGQVGARILDTRGKVQCIQFKECPSCQGAGVAVYTRGVSLVPIIERGSN